MTLLAPLEDLPSWPGAASGAHAMATLEGKERDLIALKFSGGLSNAEIARVLGMSETNAGTRLHRALTKLRKACNDEP